MNFISGIRHFLFHKLQGISLYLGAKDECGKEFCNLTDTFALSGFECSIGCQMGRYRKRKASSKSSESSIPGFQFAKFR